MALSLYNTSLVARETFYIEFKAIVSKADITSVNVTHLYKAG